MMACAYILLYTPWDLSFINNTKFVFFPSLLSRVCLEVGIPWVFNGRCKWSVIATSKRGWHFVDVSIAW